MLHPLAEQRIHGYGRGGPIGRRPISHDNQLLLIFDMRLGRLRRGGGAHVSRPAPLRTRRLPGLVSRAGCLACTRNRDVSHHPDAEREYGPPGSAPPVVVAVRSPVTAPVSVRRYNTSGERDSRESKQDEPKHVPSLHAGNVASSWCKIIWGNVADFMATSGWV